jgi:hypothetical protein
MGIFRKFVASSAHLLIAIFAIAVISPGIRSKSVSNVCVLRAHSPQTNSKFGCEHGITLRLRGGSWNPVKWFEDAFESTVKEDVKEMLHPEQDVAADGSEQEAANGTGQSRLYLHVHFTCAHTFYDRLFLPAQSTASKFCRSTCITTEPKY